MARCMPITSGTPNYVLALNQHRTSMKNGVLAQVGLGGPGLTTAALNAAITDLRATLDHNAAEQLRYERERASKTFTQKHSLALAECLHRLCGVTWDEDLPAVHQQLAASTGKH